MIKEPLPSDFYLCFKKGYTIEEMCTKYYVSRWVINRWLRELNLNRRLNLEEILSEEYLKNCINSGMSLKDISNDTGYCIKTITKRAKVLDVKVTKKERINNIDINIFQELFNKGLGYKKIGESFGFSETAMRNFASKHGFTR